jgi:hypothetical protein
LTKPRFNEARAFLLGKTSHETTGNAPRAELQ